MVGVAVNVTFVPTQMVAPVFADTDTDGTRAGLTVTVDEELFTVSSERQTALDVRRTAITSPFAKELSV